MMDDRFQRKEAGYGLTGWLFLRGLGCIYLMAFASLSTQVLGLMGSHGLLPVHLYLQKGAFAYGIFERLWKMPTLFWLVSGDTALQWGCWVGMGVSILLILNLAPRVCCVFLWVLYLSFVTAGQVFFAFQWDNLLLETGFLAIFLAPSRWGWKCRGTEEPSQMIRWLFLLLVLRFHVQSGLSKLMSGDETWRNLTAMDYYYETAPIPTLLGWWANQLPHGVHSFSVVMTFVLELAVPFLLVIPGWTRRLAIIPLMLLQVIIQLTANYTYFNLLTLLLCIWAWDDDFFKKLRMGRWGAGEKEGMFPGRGWMPDGIRYAGFWFVVLISLLGTHLMPFLAPFRSINAYGLFAVMTTERWELDIQGSRDGAEWKSYSFKYKPGDLNRPPPFVAPHQPRLDFQCWFLSPGGKGNIRDHPYLVNLMVRLFEGEKEVLKLLGNNPFPDRPPQYLRLWVRQMGMTDVKEQGKSGRYWETLDSRLWCPTMRNPRGNGE